MFVRVVQVRGIYGKDGFQKNFFGKHQQTYRKIIRRAKHLYQASCKKNKLGLLPQGILLYAGGHDSRATDANQINPTHEMAWS